MSEELFKGLSEVRLAALTNEILLMGQKCFEAGLEEGHASRDAEFKAQVVGHAKTAADLAKAEQDLKNSRMSNGKTVIEATALYEALVAERRKTAAYREVAIFERQKFHPQMSPECRLAWSRTVVDDQVQKIIEGGGKGGENERQKCLDNERRPEN